MISENDGFGRNVSEIEKITNHRRRSLAIDEVVSMPKNKCRNRREKYWF